MLESSTKPTPSFDALRVPDMSPRGLLRQFGPGMILMMTGIGASHLVTAPTARVPDPHSGQDLRGDAVREWEGARNEKCCARG